MFGLFGRVKLILFLLLLIAIAVVCFIAGMSAGNPEIGGFILHALTGVDVDLSALLQEQGLTVLSEPYTSGGYTYYPLDGIPANIAPERMQILFFSRAQIRWEGIVGDIARKIAGLDKVVVLAIPER